MGFSKRRNIGEGRYGLVGCSARLGYIYGGRWTNMKGLGVEDKKRMLKKKEMEEPYVQILGLPGFPPTFALKI